MSKYSQLKELAEKATEGPWSHCSDEEEVHSDARIELNGDPVHVYSQFRVMKTKNRDFIAAANPQVVLEMITEIEEWRRQTQLEISVRMEHEKYIESLSEKMKIAEEALQSISDYWNGDFNQQATGDMSSYSSNLAKKTIQELGS